MQPTKQDKNESYLCADMGLESLDTAYVFPLYFQIETTSACNARCRMCPRSFTTFSRENNIMGADLRSKIIEELAEHASHIRRVSPFGYGEPLLDTDLPIFIKQLKQIGIKEVFISTNASLLTEEMAGRLLESGLDQIDFSVDAFTPEIYEEIRVGLNRDKVYRNVERFIAMRNGGNWPTKIRFRYVLQETNQEDYHLFKDYWGEKLSHSDSISAKIKHTFGGNIDQIESEEYKKLMEINSKTPCKALFSSMSILVNGDVSVCNYDMEQKFFIGNINETKIKNIWNHETLNQRRKLHLNTGRGGSKMCSKCNSWLPDVKLEEIVL
jgi:Predicted Fe-S oxidoreductases